MLDVYLQVYGIAKPMPQYALLKTSPFQVHIAELPRHDFQTLKSRETEKI